MPLYEYDCPACGQSFEKRVKMSESDAVVCPVCGGTHPQRRLSRIAISGQKSAPAVSASLPVGGL